MKKIISYSLWGDQPKYTVGAWRNAVRCREIYPGWTARFYVGRSVPRPVLERLRTAGAEIVEKEAAGDWTGMLWRFEAAGDPEVSVMLSRDCDSRPGPREAAAVNAWLQSPATFHIMRDHPQHTAAIMGGMWGIKAPGLRDLPAQMTRHAVENRYQTDQQFLRDVIHPQVRDRALVHDEFFCGHRFPTPRQGREYVGEPLDETERPDSQGRRILAAVLKESPGWTLLRRILGRSIIRGGCVCRIYNRAAMHNHLA